MNFHPETKAYTLRRRSEGKNDREVRRCLKRHLTRRIFRLLKDLDTLQKHPHGQLNPARPSQTEWIRSAPCHFLVEGTRGGARRAQRRSRWALCAGRLHASRWYRIPDRSEAACVNHHYSGRSGRRRRHPRRAQRGGRCFVRRGDRTCRLRTACTPRRPPGW